MGKITKAENYKLVYWYVNGGIPVVVCKKCNGTGEVDHMREIFWDIDGVTRALSLKVHGCYPDSWFHKSGGFSIIEHVDKDLTILENSEGTEYLPIIKRIDNPTFITRCKVSWDEHTTRWLSKHLHEYTVNYTRVAEHKFEIVGKDGLIVEDYPNFDEAYYKQVILVRRPYNEKVPDEWCYKGRSVKEPSDLVKFLEEEGVKLCGKIG